MSGGSSAALTTTHLPHLRASLDEWREKQPALKSFTTPKQDLASRLAEETAVSGKQGKDIVVAFRTRPSLPNEAEEKFHALEAKEKPAAETQSENAEQAEVTLAEPIKVEFCSGVTAASAEPGTFVCHVPGFKVCSLRLYSRDRRLMHTFLVVRTYSYSQILRCGPCIRSDH